MYLYTYIYMYINIYAYIYINIYTFHTPLLCPDRVAIGAKSEVRHKRIVLSYFNKREI
jgi:hypothetical protein